MAKHSLELKTQKGLTNLLLNTDTESMLLASFDSKDNKKTISDLKAFLDKKITANDVSKLSKVWKANKGYGQKFQDAVYDLVEKKGWFKTELTTKNLKLKHDKNKDQWRIELHDKNRVLLLILLPFDDMYTPYMKELHKFMIAKLDTQDVYDNLDNSGDVDTRKFKSMLVSKGWKQQPPLTKGNQQNLKQGRERLKWIHKEIEKGNNILVQTNLNITTWTPKTFKAYQKQGIEPFMVGRKGDFYMAHGKKYLAIPLSVVQITSAKP